MKGAYYNENDPFAAAWLRNLIAAGHIAQGDVDERSIADVRVEDLAGYSQYHFFAGIGGWSLALRLAGWPDDRPVWTGSCPCQPFSAAGQRKGFNDARHLWPQWFRLVREYRPVTILGEQVASALSWLDLVSGDLEGEGYAVGAAILGAHSVGAPHIRQRVYWVAYAEPQFNGSGGTRSRRWIESANGSGMVESSQQQARLPRRAWEPRESGGELGQSYGARPFEGNESAATNGHERTAIPTSFWTECDWLPCIDSKSRPVEPGTFPLAHGLLARVGRLRGYGNAIVPQVAQAFIEAYMECVP